jgi:hypothetical protein
MTHRIKEAVVAEAKADRDFFEKAGLIVLDPVEEEQVKPTKEKLIASRKAVEKYWVRDKYLIRQAHVVLDMTPHMKSFGTEKELGYARYHLWKKVIRVFPKDQMPVASCVAYLEDDEVVDSREMALESILRTHETLWDRLKWRASIYRRCYLKAIYNRLREWK